MAGKTTQVENLHANIVIIGGGGAGLAAAVSATEMGATGIIVLEKRGLGGNSAMAFNLFAADSPVQKRNHIDCSRDTCYQMAMNFAHWRINPRIIRAFIEKSGETIAWLENKGVEFSCGQGPIPGAADSLPTPHMVKGGGAVIINTLIRECEGSGIKLFTHTPAKSIITDASGRITGVVAKDQNGTVFNIRTGTVIIATGGFGGNKRLLKKYCSYYHENMACDGIPHAGDGFLMAMKMGAATAGFGALVSAAPCAPNSVFVNASTPSGEHKISLKGLAGECYAVWVNKKGTRFTDECVTFYHYEVPNVLGQQPEKVSYSLYDSKMMQQMIDEGRGLGMGMPGLPGAKTAAKITLLELSKALQQTVSGKTWVKVASSWKEIARWIGADPQVLSETVNEYNKACETGHDQVFAKDPKYLIPLREPPYFAVEGHITYVNTLGGIKINEHMEVLDTRDEKIAGLLAAGVDTGGWESETYCSRMSGHAFGFAVNSGRIAGETAAKRVLGR